MNVGELKTQLDKYDDEDTVLLTDSNEDDWHVDSVSSDGVDKVLIIEGTAAV